jgi:hypothetical protein
MEEEATISRPTATALDNPIQYLTDEVVPAATICVHPIVFLAWVAAAQVVCYNCGQQLAVTTYTGP